MDLSYKKRAGTSGISGQLYETKLISLILFRLLRDDSVEEFYIASNMDDIGAFDDICLKIKIVGRKRPIIALIQAKHKEEENTFLTYDLIQNLYDSFIKVKLKFCLNEGTFFNGKFEDTDCLFILYTNAKFKISRNIHLNRLNNFCDKLKNLIATSNADLQSCRADKNLDYINEIILEEELSMLAEHFAKFLNNKTNQSMNIMNDYFISRYHVILTENVVNVSKVKYEKDKSNQWRELTFREDFFDTDDEIIKMLKNKICTQIFHTQIEINNHNTVKEKENSKDNSVKSDAPTVDQLISLFLHDPSVATLSPLIGTHVIYKDGNFEFSAERSEEDYQKLKQLEVSPLTVQLAEIKAAVNYLSLLTLKVPVTFGNIDIKISGIKKKKMKKRLHALTNFFGNLCEQSQELSDSLKVVIINDSVRDNVIKHFGDVSSAIGNLLVYDKDTGLLKFTKKYQFLQNKARKLLIKLNRMQRNSNGKINNLDLYRFDVRTIATFPKLVFDSANEVEAMFEQAVIYDKQRNHNGVETILKQEIEEYRRNNNQYNSSIKSDSMVIHYHHEIQKWWMFSKTSTYLTKTENDNIYQQALNNIITEPQISAMQTTFNMNNMKYFGYSFNNNALEINDTRTIIETDIFTLTIIKVIQCLKHNTYAVLDLEYMLHLSKDTMNTLIHEVKKTKKNLIIICKITKETRLLYSTLEELAQATEEKKIIVITQKAFSEIVQEYFLPAKVVNDEGQSLSDLDPDTQNYIMKNTETTFQGQEITNLNLLLDEVTVKYVKGAVLNKIVSNQNVTIGKPLSNMRYEKMKHLYVDRTFRRFNYDYKYKLVTTFDDINGDAVLITAKPEMGKSTLLTHLSVTTKKIHNNLWIFQINLLDHSKVLFDWTVNRTVVDTLTTLQFICQVLVNNVNCSINLTDINGKVYLDGSTGDEWADFELNMFLHFYNERKVMFIFDGFDEICPLYKVKTMRLLDTIINNLRKHKMCVTSRPYTEILPDLRNSLNNHYELESIDPTDQKTYLHNYWQDKIVMDQLSTAQLANVTSFIDFVRLNKEFQLDSIVYVFYDYLNSYFPHIDERNDLAKVPITLNNNYELIHKRDDNIKAGMIQHQVQILTGIPLILYICAEHFTKIILNDYTNLKEWHYNIIYSAYEIYKMTIKEKLRILYEEKNEMDITKPHILDKYVKEYKNCVDRHKKLAAHALIFHGLRVEELKNMAPFNNSLDEYETMLNEIRDGTERAGLVSHVTEDNVPVFIFKSFAEYFTAAYICDVFKSNKFETSVMNILFNPLFLTVGIADWIRKESNIDLELNYILKKLKSAVW